MKYLPTSIDDIKDKKLKAHLRSIPLFLMKLKIKNWVNLKNQSEHSVTTKIIN